MTESIVLEEVQDRFEMDIIENQVYLIANIYELPDELYDNMAADKIKAISQAFRVIYKAQKSLLDKL
jgi:hypothetical protein